MKKGKSKRAAAPHADRLADLVERFAGRRVLVVGDVILDRYLWGDVERTSPEAPVPVVGVQRESTVLGGAANVVLNLAALGARATILGVVGRDEAAEELRHLLEAHVLIRAKLISDPSRPTTVKARVMSMGQQLLRLDYERAGDLAEKIRGRLLKSFEQSLRAAEIVILSDYGKGVLAGPTCEAMIATALAADKQVIVDPKGLDYTKYRGATIVKPNQKEAGEAAGIRITDDDSLEKAARRLQRTLRAQGLVITRGAQGVSVFERRRKPEHFAAAARQVYDVTGAGDSFIAAMSLALVAGGTLPEAARIGGAAGSIVVGKVGSAAPTPRELRNALHPDQARGKLRTAKQIRAEIDPLRAEGKRIVFTNGCFDLIHPGHVKFLERARALGDILIVALNSDRGVREIKGPPRPVLGERERVSLLAALESVDYLVVFDETTPDQLLKKIEPDILVKGKVLKRDQVAGRGIVEAHGGRVVLLPQLDEAETQSMLEKIGREIGA